MLKDGQRGVILQRDKKTYAIAPHIPCGLVTPEILERIAAVARKYSPLRLKITSAARIALIGIKEEEVEGVWKDLGLDQGHAVGLCVRSIKVCPGITCCRLARQDSLQMGMTLDKRYHGMAMPSKMKMAVSGCKIQCGENCIKDLSLYGTEAGWTLLVGGMGGIAPRFADILVTGLSSEDAEAMVEKVMAYYREHSRRARLGFFIDEIGIEAFRKEVVGN